MKNYKDTCQNTLIASGKQNFQGEVTSGFVMKLIEQTLENIKYGRQSRWHCHDLVWPQVSTPFTKIAPLESLGSRLGAGAGSC